MPHLYVTDDGAVWNLDRCDALFLYGGEVVARFSSASFPHSESHLPTIYDEPDAREELGRILRWLEGGPDPCANRRKKLVAVARSNR
jgi:hypothetical protein